MSLFHTNNQITQQYEIQYNTIKHKTQEKRVELRNQIASVVTNHAKIILESNDHDDIGNPAKICDELSDLKLKYSNIVNNEETELKKIMENYRNKLFENMMGINNQNDDIKLRVYETYMSKPINQWDGVVERGGLITAEGQFLSTISRSNGSNPTIRPQALPAEIWLSAFKNTIDTKISEEIEVKNNFLSVLGEKKKICTQLGMVYNN